MQSLLQPKGWHTCLCTCLPASWKAAEFLSAMLQLTDKGLWGDSCLLGSGGGWDSGGVSVLAGLLKMGPLSLPLDLASLITRIHQQRSAEAQIIGQRVSMSARTGRLQKVPWLGWRD